MRKIIKILILILVLAAIGLGVYLIWQYFLKPAPVAPTVEEKKAGVVVAPSLTLISSQPIFDYWLNRTDNSTYYLTREGEIYKILSDGSEEKVISQTFQNLHGIIPSPVGESVIFSFGYPFSPTFSIFKTADVSWQPLPEGTTSAAWNPQSSTTNSIAFLQTNAATGLSSLNILSLADQKSKEIIRLNQKDLDLEWVLPDTVYLKQKPSTEIPSSLWAVDLNLGKIDKKTKKAIGPVVRSVIKDESGLMINWSATENLGLKFISTRVPENRLLSLVDNKNQFIASFVFITLPSKCVFAEKLLYCAVPHEIPPGTILPDDYLKRRVYFLDSLYQMDLSSPVLTTWAFSEVFDGFQFPIDAIHLEIQNSNLIFINRYDQKLYSLKPGGEAVETTPTEAATETMGETITE